MATAEDVVAVETLADVVEALGGIPLNRIRSRPALGTATEDDLIAEESKSGRLCELVDGILVEKGMGYREGELALILGSILLSHVRPRGLGIVAGPDGMMRLVPGLVRLPDISFVSWANVPGQKRPDRPIANFAPDLAVEVISLSNTRAELARKRREYFAAGTRLVWEVDPRTRTVDVYTAPDVSTRLDDAATLDGGDVLPGFSVAVKEIFDDPVPPAVP